MPNLDSVLTTLNTNTETNTAIYSSQFDSVGRNGHLLAALPIVWAYTAIIINNMFPACREDRRLTLGAEI